VRFKEALTYDDVLLVPQYSDIQSRKEIDVGNFLDDNIHLELPVISSPMDTVTESDMGIAMYKAGGLGVVHRYNTPAEQVAIINQIQQNTDASIAAAVGVTGDFESRARSVFDAGANIICIDVAHGHHILMKSALETLRNIFGIAAHLMAGNVATRQGYEDLADWGADSVRCNVGGGSICSTRIQTGHGVPGLQTIFDCAQSDRDAKIIADGGIKSSGDMVKALAAGADFIMIGSMLAGTKESPGLIVNERNGSKHKTYRGMASKEAQMDWRAKYSSNEGVSTRIPYKGSVADVLRDIKNGLASGFSYSGARNIKQLWTGAEWIRQTSAGLTESKTHILERH
jgi:IMP dehydrogenase